MDVLVLLLAVFFVWLFGFRGAFAVGCCRLCGGLLVWCSTCGVLGVVVWICWMLCGCCLVLC